MIVDSDTVALDLETRDPDLKELGPGWAYHQPADKTGYPVGYALSWRSEATGQIINKYFPVRHEGGGNMEFAEVRKILGPVLADKRIRKVGANMGYDYGWTLWDGFDLQGPIDDVQIDAPLLDDNRMSFSLNNLGKDYLGISKSEDGLFKAAAELGIKDVKANLWRLPAGMVQEYAEGDTELTLLLHEHFKPMIIEEDLWRVKEVETRLIPLLYKMRKRGVPVDLERAHLIHEMLSKKEKDARELLDHLSTCHVDPWTSSTIIKSLEAEGVTEFPKTEKKQEKSITSEFLQELSEVGDNRASNIARAVYHLRKYNRAKTTFVERMIFDHHRNGIIHTELKALRGDDGGTVSGRFSSTNPNLQQVPARDPELGPLIRSIFVPFGDDQWASLDYSSQEPKIALHFAYLLKCKGAAEMVEKYRADPRLDAYLPTAELCGIVRKDAKTIKLGILYGMGGGKLCASLGLPTEEGVWKGKPVTYAGEEGKALLEKFHEASPMDRELSKTAQSKAKRTGFVKTLLGRRSRFPRRPNGEVWFTHKALNRIIQGSAADMMKKAMLDCDDAGITPILSVHDELAFSIGSRDEAERAAELMSNALPLCIPVPCDIEIGRTWGHSMDPDIDDKILG